MDIARWSPRVCKRTSQICCLNEWWDDPTGVEMTMSNKYYFMDSISTNVSFWHGVFLLGIYFFVENATSMSNSTSRYVLWLKLWESDMDFSWQWSLDRQPWPWEIMYFFFSWPSSLWPNWNKAHVLLVFCVSMMVMLELPWWVP